MDLKIMYTNLLIADLEVKNAYNDLENNPYSKKFNKIYEEKANRQKEVFENFLTELSNQTGFDKEKLAIVVRTERHKVEKILDIEVNKIKILKGV